MENNQENNKQAMNKKAIISGLVALVIGIIVLVVGISIYKSVFGSDSSDNNETSILSDESFQIDKSIKLYTIVKKTVNIPKWVNTKAEELRINFSKTLEEALLDKIQNLNK